jgi:hypothetical protein
MSLLAAISWLEVANKLLLVEFFLAFYKLLCEQIAELFGASTTLLIFFC